MQEELPIRMSYLEFLFQALGWRYAVLLPLAALFSVVVVLALVLRGRGTTLSAALLLVVPLPFYVGILSVIDGLQASFHVIAMTGAWPKPSAMNLGIAMLLVIVWVGLLLSIPGFLIAVAGTVVRSLVGDPTPQALHPPRKL